jgi:hypothetical protein
VQAAKDNSLPLTESIANRALLEVEQHLQRQNKSLLLYGMPLPEDTSVPSEFLSQMEATEHDYNVERCAAEVQDNVPKLRPAQAEVWEKVTAALELPADATVSVSHAHLDLDHISYLAVLLL